MYQVLNGPTYSENDRPPFWENETALMLSMTMSGFNLELAPLADFPLIEDFEVRLEVVVPAFGHHLYFFSASHGYLASFPGWDHVEHALIQGDFMIPLGDFRHPSRGTEQGWDIVIAAEEDFVYVLEGDFASPSSSYHTWFKVGQDLYLAEWQKAIAACREAFLTSDK
jgi:hypothetical protein